MNDMESYLDQAIDKALRDIAKAESEAIGGWCNILNCTAVELADRYNIVPRMTTKADGFAITTTTELWLEPKD